MDAPAQPEPRPSSRAQVTFGLVVMLLGALMLADRFDWSSVHLNVPVWPFFLIFLGLARLSGPRIDRRGRLGINRVGVWLMFVGVWGLFNEYRLLSVHYKHSWPLLVIGAGILVVWQALDPATTCASETRGSRAS
jgi:LiaF transmembrane domain